MIQEMILKMQLNTLINNLQSRAFSNSNNSYNDIL